MAADDKYGEPAFNQTLRAFGLKRLFLHAATLSFPHPDSDEMLMLEAPLESQLKTVLERIGLGKCIS